MRAVPFLVLALLLITGLAGCSNPKKGAADRVEPVVELPDLDLPDGQPFGSMPAPAWKPGYHFRYEDAGALEVHTTGEGFLGNASEDVTTAWGPRQGLNYTVVNIGSSTIEEMTSFGEQRILALHRDANLGAGERPDLLAIGASHLEAHPAYLQTYCGFDGNCTLFVSAVDEADGVAPLTFPLKDGGVTKARVEHGLQEPFIPLGPVDVITRVLGYNEVDGPFGTVRAVHVRQDFRVNFTQLRAQSQREAPPGITDLNISGHLEAVRDVLYAPDLLNVVLDQSTSEGSYTWSYSKGGQPQEQQRSWRAWSSSRLVDATFVVQPAMPLEEIGAMLRYPTGSLDGGGFLLTASAHDANVADDDMVTYEASATSDRVASIRIDVLSAQGSVVSTQFGPTTTFRPPSVGPYLVIAYALDDEGKLIDRDYASLYAYYQDEVRLQCGQVAIDGTTSCDRFELPAALAVEMLGINALINEPTAVAGLPGRLVIDIGGGQEISAQRAGNTASLWVDRPHLESSTWAVTYRPDAAVATTVDLAIHMWPGSVPVWLYSSLDVH